MIRPTPRSTRTEPLFPHTTLVLSPLVGRRRAAPNPWLPTTPSLLQRRNAVGGGGMSFAPGLGDPGWIKTATAGFGDIAARSAEVAASNRAAKVELAAMAKATGHRLPASAKEWTTALEELRTRLPDSLTPHIQATAK